MTWQIHIGDCRDVLRSLPAQSVHTCITSPPYFGLRDYGTGEWDGGDAACDHIAAPARRAVDERPRPTAGPTRGGSQPLHEEPTRFRDVCGKCGAQRVDRQIGLEPTPDEFVAALVAVFREVRRVLRDDGTVWLNLGDSYNADGRKNSGYSDWVNKTMDGTKPKDLLGIPWMVAFALRADGWYLRSEIIWAKKNCMPESVTDRPTKSHEQIFLLSKRPTYFYDADAVREGWADERNGASGAHVSKFEDAGAMRKDGGVTQAPQVAGRNKRSVWTVATQPYAGAHFATFPPKLIEPCVLAGAPEGGTVLDPFAGSGTTGMVALRHNRSFVGIELSAAYAQMARYRILDDAPLLNQMSEVAA